MDTLHPLAHPHEDLIAPFVEYLRTATAPPGLFAEEVAATIHVGGGHYEVRTAHGLEQELRQYGGLIQTDVLARESTPSGFVLECTQRAPNGDLYEEMIWAVVEANQIRHLRWYCTGIVRQRSPA